MEYFNIICVFYPSCFFNCVLLSNTTNTNSNEWMGLNIIYQLFIYLQQWVQDLLSSCRTQAGFSCTSSLKHHVAHYHDTPQSHYTDTRSTIHALVLKGW